MRRFAPLHILRRAGLAAALALLPLSAVLSAQGGAQFPAQDQGQFQVSAGSVLQFFGGSTAARATVSPDVVVGRMLSFDRDGNGRVETSELGERMHPVVARGDANADGALDETEIRTLTQKPLTRHTPQIAGFSSSYGFGDDVGFSSRSHIEGAIDDLRLSTLRRDEAMKVVHQFMDRLEKAAGDQLAADLAGIVPAEQLAQVRQALDGQPKLVPQFIITTTSANGQANVHAVLRTVMLRTSGAGQTFGLLTLPVGSDRQALAAATAAVARYKERLRLNDADRAGISSALADVLSVQDRDDFRAAIERRPVVAAGGPLARAGTAVSVVTSGTPSVVHAENVTVVR